MTAKQKAKVITECLQLQKHAIEQIEFHQMEVIRYNQLAYNMDKQVIQLCAGTGKKRYKQR